MCKSLAHDAFLRVLFPIPLSKHALLKRTGLFAAQINQYGISEVEQMIWEVDEDSDGCVNLEEFQKMFYRGRNDRTGHEVYVCM